MYACVCIYRSTYDDGHFLAYFKRSYVDKNHSDTIGIDRASE